MALVKKSTVSDIYILESYAKKYTCVACTLYGPTANGRHRAVSLKDKEDALRHIRLHIDAGHKVPAYTVSRLT